MPFVLHVHKGYRTGLIAVCHVCGKQVLAEEANICWLPKENESIGDSYNYIIACLDPCTDALDKKYGRQATQGLELGVAYLLNNIKFNNKRAKDSIRIISMFD